MLLVLEQSLHKQELLISAEVGQFRGPSLGFEDLKVLTWPEAWEEPANTQVCKLSLYSPLRRIKQTRFFQGQTL